MQYEQAAARVRRQLIPIASRNGGLITRPAQVWALIERFHGEKAPTLPRRSGATTLAVAARQDLTQLPFIAIDPFGTSDPEDMMFAEPMLGGTSIRLIVCFTDASSLVHPGTKHWRYVRKAGYSLYCRFGGETVVVPLLGNQLAFDQFALKQGQKREVWAVEALIDIRPEHRGEIIRSQIFPATAINHHQLSFDHVEKVLQAEPAAYAEAIRSLEAATAALRERRFKQSRFPRFFGEYRGEVVVEECMIAANVLTASFAELRKLGFVYRVYQPPDYDRLIEFSQAARKQGLAQVNVEDLLDPKRLNALMTALKDLGPPAKPLFLQMLHAFFGQADYDTENRGHKSLGVECYARIKPRCLDGAFNQYALRRHFSHQPLLPEDQAISVAHRCRKVQRHKDDNESRLYGLVHAARDAELVGQEFSAEVGRIGVRSLRIFVPGFWKCVMRTKDPSRLAGARQIRVKYLGFSPAAGVHRFSEVEQSA